MDMWLVVVGSIFGNRPTGSGREARVQAKAMHQHTHSQPAPFVLSSSLALEATSSSSSQSPAFSGRRNISLHLHQPNTLPGSQGPRVGEVYMLHSCEPGNVPIQSCIFIVVARYIISPGFRTILQGQEVGVGCMTVTHAGPTLSLIRGGQTDGSSHSLPPSLPVIFLLHGGVAVSPAASEDALKLASLPPSSVPLIPPSPPAKKASSPRFKTLRVHPWMGLVGFTAFASHSWGILLFYEQPSALWLGTWLRERTAADRI